MASYPYILAPDALRGFLEQMPSSGVPKKVTQEHLVTLGFKSNNHRPIRPILRFIGFLDNDGAPLERYRQFRDTRKSGAVMAQALRDAYSELFDLYPDAYRKDDEALLNFFRGKTDLGDRALSAAVATFKVLAEKADFSADPLVAEVIPPPDPEQRAEDKTEPHPRRRHAAASAGPGLAITIQLHIPATSDATIYDSLFKALRKYVLDVDTEQ